MLGYMFWGGGCQGNGTVCTYPPDTCQIGVGTGATTSIFRCQCRRCGNNESGKFGGCGGLLCLVAFHILRRTPSTSVRTPGDQRKDHQGHKKHTMGIMKGTIAKLKILRDADRAPDAPRLESGTARTESAG